MKYLSQNIMKDIANHAKKSSPLECCGLIVHNDNGYHSFPCLNLADDKYNSFSISPVDYIRADKIGHIEACYHSHCNPNHNLELTEMDKWSAKNHNIPMILYDVRLDKFTTSESASNHAKYIGRKFKYNHDDCLSLVEEFYQNEFGILLPHTDRNDNTVKDNPSIMIENISKYGFREVIDLPKYGDIILLNTHIGVTHLMLYIGDGQILHTSHNKYSSIELYSNDYKRLTHKILRHGWLCN